MQGYKGLIVISLFWTVLAAFLFQTFLGEMNLSLHYSKQSKSGEVLTNKSLDNVQNVIFLGCII